MLKTNLNETNIITFGKNKLSEEYAISAIEILANKYENLKANDNKTLLIVKKAIADIRARRVSIEKRRKELKEPFITAGRLLDTEAKKLVSLLQNIESPLIEEKNTYEENLLRVEEAKKEKDRLRVEKIKIKISEISALLNNIHQKNSQDIANDLLFLNSCLDKDDFDYQEFSSEAYLNKINTKKDIQEVLKAKLKQEQIEAETKAEKLRLEKERAEIEAEKLKIQEEKAEIEAERLRLDIIERPEPIIMGGGGPEYVGSSEIEVDRLRHFLTGGGSSEPIIMGGGGGGSSEISTIKQDAYKVSENMLSIQDPFINALGKAFAHATDFECEALKATFNEYWETFINISDMEYLVKYIAQKRLEQLENLKSEI